jgi:hypothetical protein
MPSIKSYSVNGTLRLDAHPFGLPGTKTCLVNPRAASAQSIDRDLTPVTQPLPRNIT